MRRPVIYCTALIEIGWLLTLLAVPLYFNVNDQRIFEPDKALLLRDAAALLGTFALLRLMLGVLWTPRAGQRTTPTPRLREHVRGTLAWASGLWPLFALAAVTALATATSILPTVSLTGSYARGQGLLTTLAYLVVALVVWGFVRTQGQTRRLVAVMALSGLGPAAYGWVQHLGRDPLPWQQADLTTRVPGTLGNPIFLGALLAMTLPLALAQLALALQLLLPAPAPTPTATTPPEPASTRRPVQALAILGWGLVVVIESGGLLFTDSRGPVAGALAALVVLGLGVAHAWHWRPLRVATLSLAGLALVVLLLLNVLGSGLLGTIRDGSPLRLVQWTPRASGTSEVRLLIWEPALQLVAQRPLLGCGPDTLLSCYYPVYPTALRHLEAPNAVPDRTHNIYLDVAAETGLLGLLAFLIMLGSGVRQIWRLIQQARHRDDQLLAAALLAALLGHLVEGAVGITVVATALLTWTIIAAARAMTRVVALEPRMSRAPAQRRCQQATSPWSPRRRATATRRSLLAALTAATAAVFSLRPDVALTPSGTPYSRQQEPTATRLVRIRPTPSSGRPAHIALALALLALATGGAGWAAWTTVASGQTAVTADVAARQGRDLETVALGNSGQAPLPPGRAVQPILALRQFAAATQAQTQALALEPQQEDYSLDAGRTLVEWAQAAAGVGGPAAQQAATLYARALLLFGQAAHLDPYDPDPLRDTGKAYERWAGLGHDPQNPRGWDQSLLDRAGQAFARAAVLAPHHPDPLTSAAQVALWQGQAQLALDLANRALHLDPQDGEGYRIRGDVESAVGQVRPALDDWRRALDDPTSGQRGPTAAETAMAEATWAHARCAAVSYARLAQDSGGLSSQQATLMAEIVHLNGGHCSR